MPKNLLAAVALVAWLASSSGQAVVYVDADAPGPAHNGSSWASAFTTISAGISALTYGGDVWIKAGTYRERVTVKSYVSLYGGFLGYETSATQRIPGAFPTVIDAGHAGAAIAIPAQAWVTLDGLTARHGLAISGGGISCGTNSIVNIRNCRVEDCRALTTAGGVYYGKYTQGEMADCVIAGCSAPNGGGGVVEYHAYPTWRRIVISGNRAAQAGGGLYCPGHSGADLANCTLVGNSAGSTGGAAHAIAEGTAQFNYCVISGNSAPSGGGLYGEGIGAMPTFTHCDFWANTGGDWSGSIPAPSQMAANFSADPLFIRPDYDEYHLHSTSPCAGVGAFPLDPVYKIGRIGVVKMLSDGAQVRLTGKIVSWADGATTYLQEPDRATAIAVTGLAGYVQGDVIASVTGTLSTDARGNRTLSATSSALQIRGVYRLRPLAMRLSWLGSATGLYARTWGRVTAVSEAGFTLTDGSASLCVRCPTTNLAPGDFVSVTGTYTAQGDFTAASAQIL